MDSREQEALGKFGPHAGRHKFSEDFSVFLDSALAENKDVLHGDDIPFHAGDFRNADDLAGAVAVPADLHHDVNGRRDLATNGGFRNIQVGHGHHGFQAAQRV